MQIFGEIPFIKPQNDTWVEAAQRSNLFVLYFVNQWTADGKKHARWWDRCMVSLGNSNDKASSAVLNFCSGCLRDTKGSKNNV